MNTGREREGNDCFLLLLLVSLLGLTTGCGGNSSSNNTQPPPPAAPTIAVSPTSASVLVGQTQTFSLTVTGNPTVTCSVNGPGSCSVSGTTSASYTGAAPASGGEWKATLSLTATNAGGSATASVAIALGQITGVTLTPASAVITTAQTQKFTAGVQCNGTCDESVNWQVSPAGTGTIASDGTFTPAQQVAGFVTVTVTATSTADPTQSANATVRVGFAWVASFHKDGMDCRGTAQVLSQDGSKFLVAYVCKAPGASDSTANAGLLSLDAATGKLLDSSWTDQDSSKLVRLVVAPDGSVYAAGYEYYQGSATAFAVVWKITVGVPIQVTVFSRFQLGAVRTEVHDEYIYNGSVYLGVNSDYKECTAYTCSEGDYSVTLDSAGKTQPELPLNTATQQSDLTGILVTDQGIYAMSNCADPGYLTTCENLYDPATGVLKITSEFSSPPVVSGSSIYQNKAGTLLIAATIVSPSSGQQCFLLEGDNDQTLYEIFNVQWDPSDNGGCASSANASQELAAAPNPQDGLTLVGACPQISGSGTRACAVALLGVWAAQPTWEQEFGEGYMPDGLSAAGWAGVGYDSQGVAYFSGWGTDGSTMCGAAPCKVVTVGKFPPPAGS